MDPATQALEERVDAAVRELEQRVTDIEKFLEHNGFTPSRVIQSEIDRLPDLQKRDPVREVEHAAAVSKASQEPRPAQTSAPVVTDNALTPLQRIIKRLTTIVHKLEIAQSALPVGTPAGSSVREALNLAEETLGIAEAADPA